MSGLQPEEDVSVPVALQKWRRVTFLHWRYEPSVVAHLIPDGLTVDEWEGDAWVGIVLFSVEGMRAGPVPLPGAMGSFPETNVRTYVRGPDGRDGLLFFSLDVDSATNAIGGRLGPQVPYYWSDMSITGDAPGTVVYRSKRRPPDNVRAGHDVAIRPGDPIDPSPFDEWLTGRWRAWTRIAGRHAAVPVQHEPWPLATATVERVEEDVLAAAGLPRADGDPIAHWSRGVDARFGPPQLVGNRSGG